MLRLALVCVVLSCFAATTASASTKSAWYWSPGLCKSSIKNDGVQLGSSVFHMVNSYCVGMHNRCWLSHGKHLYKGFSVIGISGDGVVRSFRMIVTGKYTWTGSVGTLVARHMTAAKFVATYGPKERAAAAHEVALGCTDPTG